MNEVFKYRGRLNAVWSRKDIYFNQNIAWNRLLILFWLCRVGTLCDIAQLLSQSYKPYNLSEVYLSSSVTVLLQKCPLPFISGNAYYNKGFACFPQCIPVIILTYMWAYQINKFQFSWKKIYGMWKFRLYIS